MYFSLVVSYMQTDKLNLIFSTARVEIKLRFNSFSALSFLTRLNNSKQHATGLLYSPQILQIPLPEQTAMHPIYDRVTPVYQS